MENETARLGQEIASLKDVNDTLRCSLSEVRAELDDLEQYSCRMNLDISGVPGVTGDSTDNVEKMTLNHIAKITLPDGSNIRITARDIDQCHRVGRLTQRHANQTPEKALEQVYSYKTT